MGTRTPEGLHGTTQASVERVSDRTPRALEGRALRFDMAREVASLMSEGPWLEHGHNARTLIKHDEFRVVLVVLRQGAEVREHQTYHHGAIGVLTGRLEVQLPERRIELEAPDLLALGDDVPRSITALEESSFLILLGWSD